MAKQPSDDMPSANQRPHAAIVAVIAVVAVAAVTAIVVYHYNTASDAVTVLGPVMGVISSLVAAYFGIRAGSLTQQKQNENIALLNARPAPDAGVDPGAGPPPAPSPKPSRRPQPA